MVFDIETGAYPLPELLRIDPFDVNDVKLPAHPGTFDAAAVKLGNIKDPTKVKDKIDACRTKHEKAVEDHESNKAEAIATAEREHHAALVKTAALRAEMSRVLAIGYLKTPDSVHIDGRDDEAEMIRQFWARSEKIQVAGGRMVGFNSSSFDLPYLCRRSWLLSVPVPAWLIPNYRFFHHCFVDLAEVWRCGNRQDYISLDRASRAMGRPGKTGSGAFFAQLWATDREAAKAYLKTDLLETHSFALQLGITH